MSDYCDVARLLRRYPTSEIFWYCIGDTQVLTTTTRYIHRCSTTSDYSRRCQTTSTMPDTMLRRRLPVTFEYYFDDGRLTSTDFEYYFDDCRLTSTDFEYYFGDGRLTSSTTSMMPDYFGDAWLLQCSSTTSVLPDYTHWYPTPSYVEDDRRRSSTTLKMID